MRTAELKRLRSAHGVVCPECARLRPKEHPKLLLPSETCNKRGHSYTDGRPALVGARLVEPYLMAVRDHKREREELVVRLRAEEKWSFKRIATLFRVSAVRARQMYGSACRRHEREGRDASP